MLRNLTVSLCAAALVSIAAGQGTFAQRSNTIRAGILLVESQRTPPVNGVPSNFTPHVWFNLDSNRLMKPAGWNFVNPRASTEVTPQIQARWITLVGPGLAPNVGDRITKRQAAYWEVPLAAVGDSEIADYDVLLLSVRGFVSLNPTEREKLRRFVDHGGVLWVDFTSSATLDPINSVPLPFDINTTNLGLGRFSETQHPLFNFPNTINDSSILAMETDLGAGLQALNAVNITLTPLIGSAIADSVKLLPVAGAERGGTIAVGKLGDGYIMVTSRGVSTAINRVIVPRPPAPYDPNTGYLGLTPTSDRPGNAASALAINLMHLGAGHQSTGGGSRKSNSTFVDLFAPLLKRFDIEVAFQTGSRMYSQPATYKGLVVMTTSTQVIVMDANPGADLDGDGDPDDGLRDLALGFKYDVLWTSQVLTPNLSPPATAEVPDANGAPRDVIAVAGGGGELYLFDAFQLDPQGRITGTTTASPSNTIAPPSGVPPVWDSSADNRGPHAPTILEGMAYIVDSHAVGLSNRVGRVWMADLRTGQRMSSGGDWVVGGPTGTYGSIPDVTASATVGYIPVADNSGALDRVVYVPTRNYPTNTGAPTARAGIYSLWAGVRGETIKNKTIQVGSLVVNTRASDQGVQIFTPGGVHPLGLKLTIVDSNGNPWNEAQMGAVFVGGTPSQPAGGVLNFGLRPGGDVILMGPDGQPNTPDDLRIVLDYTLDWGFSTGLPLAFNPIIRGSLNLPDDGSNLRRIINTIALSPRGSIFVAHGSQTAGGALYAFKEDGRGQFKMTYRWEIFNQHQINLNQASPIQYREALVDTDPLTQFAPGFLAGPLGNMSFQSGPTVRNDTVYVTARAYKNVFVPVTIVLAFRAEPEPIQIRVGELPGNFTIVQPDLARSTSKSIPEQFSVLQPNQYVYERDPGSDSGTIRIENVSGTTRGPITHSLSTSQPIIIRRAGQPDLLLEPGATSTRWNPMLWFAVLHGVENSSPMLVTGETGFVTGTSMLPVILDTGNIGTPKGVVMGIDSTISPTDPFLASDALRPWQKQLYQMKIGSGGPPNIIPNPDIRWPQFGGAQSFDDWRVRYFQTVMDDGPALGVMGGEGALFVWQQNKLWSFSRSDFIVADEGRLSKFDPSGNPIWSSDQTVNAGNADQSNTGSVKPLVRPTRAYPLSSNELLVVDSGGDRVLRMDTAGREIRSISGFKIDPAFTPEGFESNEALTLRQPRDVVLYRSYEANPPNVTNPRPLEYWVRYVIADAGNKRLVEVIDRYEADPATRRVIGPIDLAPGNRAIGVLNWHSPASFSGKNYIYTSVARVWNEISGRYVLAAGIGGALPTKVDTGLDTPGGGGNKPREAGTGNGGIIVFDGANSTVVNEVVMPAIGPDVLWNESTGSFNSAPRPERPRQIGNVSSVTMRIVDSGGPILSIMFTDEGGAYEIVPVGATWRVRWMMPNEAYRVLRRQGAPPLTPWLGTPIDSNAMNLRAAYARRLDSGEVLLVNSFQGLTRNRQPYMGEVLQLDGLVDLNQQSNVNADPGFSFGKVNFGFRSKHVVFELPPVQGTRGIVIPVFADRR